MRLPAMKYLEGNRKRTQIRFGGLNHTEGARDGELWDMKNLSGDHYPVLATRAQRVKIRDMEVSGGILHWNKLCWVDECDFYYDGERKGDVEEGVHTLAAIGPYVVIFPEKFYYNTETDEFGDLQAYWHGSQLKFAHAEADGLHESQDIIECQGVDWNDHFKEGDAVTISGCTERKENNLTAVIRHIDRNILCFDADIFTITEGQEYTEQVGDGSLLSLERLVPDMEFICENENRLWGCKGNRIFASMPGNPFRWNNREGLETDGWDVDTGAAGDFTGCIAYQGHPIFFKEDHIYKIYGSMPSQYQVVDTAAQGVMTGSGKSLAIAGGVLFYLSRNGVMAYSGGMPQCVSEAFGQQKFCDGVAGSDGVKYYISMRTGEQWGLYVYDTRRGLWFKEDEACVMGFAFDDGVLYMLSDFAGGSLNAIGELAPGVGDILPGMEAKSEEMMEWFAEFADFTEEDPNKKGISKIQIRLELDEGATVQAWMMFDSDGQWVPVGHAISEGTKHSYYLPIVPRRADHYRLKLTGTGGCRIYSLTLETYSGSEL